MMASNHVRGGVALWLLVAAAAPLPPAAEIAGVPIAAAASFIPDLDHPITKISNSGGILTQWLSRRVRRWFGGHRYGTHSLILGAPLCAVLSAVLVACGWWAAEIRAGHSLGSPWSAVGLIAAASYVGAASHALLDSVTCNCAWCDHRPGSRWPPVTLEHCSRDGRPAPGCALLYPWVRRRVGLPMLAVNSWREKKIVAPLLYGLGIVAATLTVFGW